MTKLPIEEPRELRFSHYYTKMPENWQEKQAQLLFIYVVDIEKQTVELLNYDTRYIDSEQNRGYYPLPKKGRFLFMLLDIEGTLATTFRRWYIEKERYYRNLVGQFVKLVKVDE